jgi:hypothetical protein
MQITEVSVIGVRSAVVVLRHPQTPLRFALFPMVHIGRPEFYTEVTTRLRRCQLVVAEGYDGPSSTGLAYRIALRATLQHAAGGLTHQDIDFGALGVPVIWPEKPTSRKPRRGRMPRVETAAALLLAPFLILTMAVGGRRFLLRRHLEVSDSTEPRIFLRFLQEPLFDLRDAELLASLEEIHGERKDEPIQVAVVYGAGHLPAVVRGLSSRFGYRAAGGEWLTVIDF